MRAVNSSSSIVADRWAAQRRFQPAVLGLLRPPGALRAAIADSARGPAGGGGAYRGGAFTGPGAECAAGGCALSAAEWSVLARVKGEPMSWEV